MRRQNFRPAPGPAYPIPAVVNPNPPIDPGMMVAMSQIRPPTLEGLKIQQIKTFKLAYRRYASKVPVVQWVRSPGQLALSEQLVTIAAFNGIGEVNDLRLMEEEQFFRCLCRIHNATMTTQWCRLLEATPLFGHWNRS